MAPGAGSFPTFDELVQLLVGGNDPATGYSGVFTEKVDGKVVRRRRVWRLRHMARVEDPPGHTRVLAGDHTYWQAADDFNDEIWELRDEDSGHIPTIRLHDPREYWSEWLGTNPRLVMDTLRAVEFEGRAAWRFTAPEVKGGKPSVTVDAETGLALELSRADVGFADTWSEVTAEPDLGAEFFEPTHRKPLVVPDHEPEPEPDALQHLEARHRILAVVARATDDWMRVCELIAAADDAGDARRAVAAHLCVDEDLADAVLSAQYRGLSKQHRESLRMQLVEMTGQLDELR